MSVLLFGVPVYNDNVTCSALNCAQSVVVTDNVVTSTFGKHHTIPSLWMSWLSPVLGVERASVWGDKVVTLLNNWNLV